MFKFIKNLFNKNKIKNYSTTLETSKEGVDSKAKLNSQILEIVNKTKRNETITNNELNLLSSYYFNKPEITVAPYTVNKLFLNSMVFSINEVHTVTDINNDLVDIKLTLNEITLGNDINLTISIKDFHEVLKPLILSN